MRHLSLGLVAITSLNLTLCARTDSSIITGRLKAQP